MWTCWSVSNHCWITPAGYELMTGHSPSRFSAEFIHGSVTYDNSSRSWSSKAALGHHTTTAMVDCCYHSLFMKYCVSVTPDIPGHKPPKITFASSVHRILGINFCQMWDEPLCSFWSATVLALVLSHLLHFCPVSLSLFILLFLLLNCEHWP